MPEDMCTELIKALDVLQDNTFDTPIVRTQKYKVIQNVLNSDAEISVTVIERVLAVCVHNMKDDKKYSSTSMTIISSILKRIKSGQCDTIPDLIQSALAIMDMIKTTVSNKADTLRVMCFETLLQYPDETFVEIATSHANEITALFNIFCHQSPIEVRLLPCLLLTKLLKVLPPEKRTIFVKDNLKLWFVNLIPTILNSELNGLNNMNHVEALELLAEELQHIEYSDNPHWEFLFGCIYNPKKYPLVMKSLLDSGNPYWHRLWIVFIKLLKNQITRSNSQGSPINALLPVVESAFKMDVPNRCRAFKCWEVLIDNFSKETNEVYINKRLKLLIIPLHSNNAKVEETAIAKLNTWWHLIRQFQNKLDKFLDTVLMAFLNFCFGKNVASPKATFVPGLISNKVKKMGVEAFIDIAGHLDCPGCGLMPRLDKRMMNTQMLVCYWNNFAYCLRKAIVIAADETVGLTVSQAQCLWKSFVLTIGELPENNVRRDIFNELLLVLEKLTQDNDQCGADNDKIKLADLILNLIFSLFTNENDKIVSLLTTKILNEGPMFKILSIILGPISSNLYNRDDSAGCVSKLKSVTNCILNENMCSVSHVVDWLIKNLSPNDNTLAVWTALAQSIHENTTKTNSLNLNNILLWPLQNITKFTDTAMASSAWYNLYTLAYTNNNSIVDKEISQVVKSTTITDDNKIFVLNASLAILKLKLIKDGNNVEEDINVVWNAVSKIDKFETIEKILLVLIDTLILLTNKNVDNTNATAAEYSITTTIKILTLLKRQSPETIKGLLQFIEQLHENIETFFRKTASLPLRRKIILELTDYAAVDSEHQKKEIVHLLNSCLCQIKEADISFYTTIRNKIDGLNPKVFSNINQSNDNNNFTTPKTKAITRKAKKREASIVNTVVENGEEYVVVKSNWKFNPRKLTDNQKEKLQRKREDIPALYQDLSQSQEEFKMASWKTDSQDSSTTNSSKSNSKTSEEPASILKLMPNSDVVPKIMENILSERTPKADANKEKVLNENDKSVDDNSGKMKQMIHKNVKSPRIALKDRVFRNVRNLIEKSTLPSNGKEMSESLIQIENVPKTPVAAETKTTNMVSSAPPKINTERPSRVKRKPKKFDDAELFGLKKRRNSSGQIDFQVDNETSHSQSEETNVQTETPSNLETVTANEDVIIASNAEPMIKTDETDDMKAVDLPLNTSTEETVVKKLEEDQTVVKKLEKENIIASQDVIPINTEKEKNIEIEITETAVPKEDKVEQEISKTTEKDNKLLITPKSIRKKDIQESSLKRSTSKKSRIEKELAIDMVEGHPFLKTQTVKRLTRKNLNNSANNSRRTSLVEKISKLKTDVKTPVKLDKKKDKSKESEKEKSKDVSMTSKIEELKQDRSFDSIDDAPCSEDIIESSQDSTVTTISVKSAKPVVKKALVVLETVHVLSKHTNQVNETQNLLNAESQNIIFSDNKEGNKDDSKEDIEIPQNKTAEDAHKDEDLTETMDTEPFDSKIVDEIIVISDDVPLISLDTDNSVVGPETQALAEADTLPNSTYVEHQSNEVIIDANKMTVDSIVTEEDVKDENKAQSDKENKTDLTVAKTSHVISTENDNDASSPFRDDVQRKQDFLDNTLEISPIKTMSPDRAEKSPSPETSNDYVLIKLTSPVQSNGEPFEKCDSPEIFTEEKISPDKRDLSPSREEIVVTNTSPSSNLSLKKNRPQVRSGGRAAQMLGLCVPDRLQSLINSERSDAEEPKRSPLTTPARRNLRILYNSVGDNNENSEENEDSENFLKLKRSLPTADSSPSVPILKRKLAEITDEATVSPASKRKRVSFHDPPVSTTISVHKYIEPCGIRSPQNSALKRQERQLRSQTNMKSSKRLDTAFKLDTDVSKAVDSFDDSEKNLSVDDTQMTSLDETPVAEIVKTSDLNDTDPICPDLVDCTDSIEVIASELSSPATKIMFLKELEGKIVTIGDLAKMTELEVNRLCIKAPKVKIAEKVLSDYVLKRVVPLQKEVEKEIMEVQEPAIETVTDILRTDVEVQTIIECMDADMQTKITEFESVYMQTDEISTAETHAQTIESGSNSTDFVIKSCLSERPDFIEGLDKNLPDTSKQQIAESLSFKDIKNSFMKKVTNDNSTLAISDILEKTVPNDSDGSDLSRLQMYLCEKYKARELTLFCSELLRKIHDKSVFD